VWHAGKTRAVELKPREIGDDEYLSQYGSRSTGSPDFRERPRLKDEGGLSVSLGRLTPAEVRSLVRLAGVPTSEDGARYVRAGDLRRQGFEVVHKPTRRNPDHAVVRYPREWDEPVAGMFNKHCSAPVWHEEPEGGS
jgi:hypothetical protein